MGTSIVGSPLRTESATVVAVTLLHLQHLCFCYQVSNQQDRRTQFALLSFYNDVVGESIYDE